MRLPDTDGVELLRRIRLSQPDLPVIITTAYMSIEPQLKVLNLPHSGYIVKPFRLDELGARIDAVLVTASRCSPPVGCVARSGASGSCATST